MTATNDNFEAAKLSLKGKLLQKGWELQHEHLRELYFISTHKRQKLKFVEDEIASYANAFPKLQIYSTTKGSLGICNTDYREELIYNVRGDFLGDYAIQRKNIQFFSTAEDATFCEVGPASDVFLWWAFTSENAYLDYCIDRAKRRNLQYWTGFDLLKRLPTIKVRNLGARDEKDCIDKSNPIIDGCLFELAYLFDLGLEIASEWPRGSAARPDWFHDRSAMENLKMPMAQFSSDIIKFFIRGIAAQDPANQFLSFYHILEYYFIEISDQILYEKLRTLIIDPKFSASRRELDRVIQETLNYRRDTNETEMLKAVIRRFTDEEGVREAIIREESKMPEKMKIYTTKQTLYGETFPKMNLEAGTLIPDVARRIKHIRNALVHSSDRYERSDRYVPSRLAEERLRQEIPLLRFLAERVIVGSAAR